MTIKLQNSTRTGTVVMAEDGDTVFVPPGEHIVPKKFTWNHPAGISTPRPAVFAENVETPVAPAKAPAPKNEDK
jgi:hypothetical protein